MSRRLLHALALALLVPGSAAAQALGARVTAGAGMDMVLYDGSTYTPGYIGQLGLEWRQSESRGAFRMDLMHFQRNRPAGMSLCEVDLECGQSGQWTVTGLSADGTFDLLRTRLRPYVLSGLGIYRSTTTSRIDYRCTGSCTDIGRPAYPYRSEVWTGGLHTGIGVSANLGRRAVFTELRMLLLATDGRQARGVLPLTLGVKF